MMNLESFGKQLTSLEGQVRKLESSQVVEQQSYSHLEEEVRKIASDMSYFITHSSAGMEGVKDSLEQRISQLKSIRGRVERMLKRHHYLTSSSKAMEENILQLDSVFSRRFPTINIISEHFTSATNREAEAKRSNAAREIAAMTLQRLVRARNLGRRVRNLTILPSDIRAYLAPHFTNLSPNQLSDLSVNICRYAMWMAHSPESWLGEPMDRIDKMLKSDQLGEVEAAIVRGNRRGGEPLVLPLSATAESTQQKKQREQKASAASSSPKPWNLFMIRSSARDRISIAIEDPRRAGMLGEGTSKKIYRGPLFDIQLRRSGGHRSVTYTPFVISRFKGASDLHACEEEDRVQARLLADCPGIKIVVPFAASAMFQGNKGRKELRALQAYYAGDLEKAIDLGSVSLDLHGDRVRVITPRERVGIVRDAGEAVVQMHALNQLHSDIKPPNIFMKYFVDDDRIEGRLGDFGLTCSSGSIDQVGESGYAYFGTVHAFQRVPLDGYRYRTFSTKASDVYGLYMTLGEAVFGRRMLRYSNNRDLIRSADFSAFAFSKVVSEGRKLKTEMHSILNKLGRSGEYQVIRGQINQVLNNDRSALVGNLEALSKSLIASYPEFESVIHKHLGAARAVYRTYEMIRAVAAADRQLDGSYGQVSPKFFLDLYNLGKNIDKTKEDLAKNRKAYTKGYDSHEKYVKECGTMREELGNELSGRIVKLAAGYTSDAFGSARANIMQEVFSLAEPHYSTDPTKAKTIVGLFHAELRKNELERELVKIDGKEKGLQQTLEKLNKVLEVEQARVDKFERQHFGYTAATFVKEAAEIESMLTSPAEIKAKADKEGKEKGGAGDSFSPYVVVD